MSSLLKDAFWKYNKIPKLSCGTAGCYSLPPYMLSTKICFSLAYAGAKPKKSKGKKKKKRQQVDMDDIKELEDDDFTHAQGHPGFSPIRSEPSVSAKNVLSLEQKNLNAENELKKIFGSRVIKAGQKKKARDRRRAYVRSTWLINAKDNWLSSWSQISETGKHTCIFFFFLFFFWQFIDSFF
jgi:hypothetical protein